MVVPVSQLNSMRSDMADVGLIIMHSEDTST
jgi:hypothetical protein